MVPVHPKQGISKPSLEQLASLKLTKRKKKKIFAFEGPLEELDDDRLKLSHFIFDADASHEQLKLKPGKGVNWQTIKRGERVAVNTAEKSLS